MIDLAAVPTEHGLCTFKPVVGGHDCPFDRQCHTCEHFVLTGADYGYWRRQEQRWAAMAEGAPDQTARDYIYEAFEKSSQALAGLEKALLALGLLDQARELDLRSPHQDFFDPIWTPGWRAGDLVHIGGEGIAEGPSCATMAPAGSRGHRVVNEPGGLTAQRPNRDAGAGHRRPPARRGRQGDRGRQGRQSLGRTGVPVTRAGVARLAGVSRSFTYENDQADAMIVAAQSRTQARALPSERQQMTAQQEAAWKERALNAEDHMRNLNANFKPSANSSATCSAACESLTAPGSRTNATSSATTTSPSRRAEPVPTRAQRTPTQARWRTGQRLPPRRAPRHTAVPQRPWTGTPAAGAPPSIWGVSGPGAKRLRFGFDPPLSAVPTRRHTRRYDRVRTPPRRAPRKRR